MASSTIEKKKVQHPAKSNIWAHTNTNKIYIPIIFHDIYLKNNNSGLGLIKQKVNLDSPEFCSIGVKLSTDIFALMVQLVIFVQSKLNENFIFFIFMTTNLLLNSIQCFSLAILWNISIYYSEMATICLSQCNFFFFISVCSNMWLYRPAWMFFHILTT